MGQRLNRLRTRNRNVRNTVGDVRAKAAVLHHDLLLADRVHAQLSQRRLNRRTTALLRLGVNLQRLLQRNREDLVLATNRAGVRALLQVRAKAAVLHGNLHALSVGAEHARQAHQLQRLLKGHGRQVHGFEQGRGARLLGLRLLLRLGLAVLVVLGRLRVQVCLNLFLGHLLDNLGDVRSEAAVASHNLAAGSRVHAEHTAVRLALFEQFAGLRLGQLVRCQVGGHVRADRFGQLAGLGIEGAFGLQVGAELAHAQHNAVSNRDGVNTAGVDFTQVIDDSLQTALRITAEVELIQPLDAGFLAARDAVEILFHLCGELVVHVGAEAGFKQAHHGERGPGGNQRTRTNVHVSAVHDGRNNRRVGGRAANAQLVQGLHEGRLGVARRRQGLVASGLNRLGGQCLAGGQVRQALLSVLRLTFGHARCVNAFLVGGEEAAEGDDGAGCCELGVLAVGGHGAQAHGGGGTGRVGHLGGDGTLPNQLVEAELVVGQGAAHGVRGAESVTRGADCLVGFLSVLALGGVHARCGRHELGAVQLGGLAACGLDRLIAQRHRVGTHVGDVTVLVQALRHLHGHAGGEAQLTRGLLLQGGGRERRCRAALVRLGLNGTHRERRGLQCGGERAGGFLVQVGDLGGVEGAVVGEVLTGGDTLAVHGDQLGVEALGGCVQEASGQVPVVGGDEGHAFAFALDHKAGRDGLHAAGGEAAADLAPEHGGNFVTVDTVEDAAGFLRVNQVQIDVAQFAEGTLNGFPGDFGEGHAVDGYLGLEDFLQVPGDGLTLAVPIGCQVERVYFFKLALELGNLLLLVRVDHIVGFEAVFNVDGELAVGALLEVFGQLGRLRKVTDMTHGRVDQVVLAEVAANGLDLGGGLHD